MKTCVSSYSFGKYISDDFLGYLGIIDKAKEMGFDGIEYVNAAYVNIPGSAKIIRERCDKVGITPVLFATGADFLRLDSESMKDEIKRVCALVDYAADMGVTMFRHDVCGGFPPSAKHSCGYADAIPYLAHGALEVTKYAEQAGIRTMSENHGFFSQDAERVEMLVNTVAHNNFGLLVDIGNFMCADEDPPDSVARCAPYAFHVHAKDFHSKPGTEDFPGSGWFTTRGGNYLRGAVIGHGDAKVRQSISVLVRAGYDGYITVEFEGIEDNLVGIALGLENLNRFIR